MVNNKTLTLTIVIPAYNEENHLKSCLNSIAKQSILPDEVLVVNNNSSDNTVKIARKFKFVTVIEETKQGQTFARNTGFNKAKGQIIGRINADVLLEPNWVEKVKNHFMDSELMGLTGLAQTITIPVLNVWHTTFWSWVYFIASDGFFRVRILWGANMAIRKSMWIEVRSETFPNDIFVHEDQDLPILIAGHGGKAIRDNKLLVTTDEYGYHNWPKFKEYMIRRWQTKLYHYGRGTLKTPNAHKLLYWQSIPRTIIMILPTFLFALSSILVYFSRELKNRVLSIK